MSDKIIHLQVLTLVSERGIISLIVKHEPQNKSSFKNFGRKHHPYKMTLKLNGAHFRSSSHTSCWALPMFTFGNANCQLYIGKGYDEWNGKLICSKVSSGWV